MAVMWHTPTPGAVPPRARGAVTAADRCRVLDLLVRQSRSVTWAAVHECALVAVCGHARTAYLARAVASGHAARATREAGNALCNPFKPNGVAASVAQADRDQRADAARHRAAGLETSLQTLEACVSACKADAGGRAQDPCRKCRSENTITMAHQARSADEGATMVCLCSACGFTWRYNT